MEKLKVIDFHIHIGLSVLLTIGIAAIKANAPVAPHAAEHHQEIPFAAAYFKL